MRARCERTEGLKNKVFCSCSAILGLFSVNSAFVLREAVAHVMGKYEGLSYIAAGQWMDMACVRVFSEDNNLV